MARHQGDVRLANLQLSASVRRQRPLRAKVVMRAGSGNEFQQTDVDSKQHTVEIQENLDLENK